jgi:CRISPR-associated protein Cmr2
MNEALLSFSLGPVQDFIAAARTTRDLWTGSYLLSWLTAQAIVELEKHSSSQENLVFPDVADNPLVQAVRAGNAGKLSGTGLLPCLPNTFLARLHGISEAEANRIANACRDTVAGEWEQISKAVRDAIKALPPWRDEAQSQWRWDDQCVDYWDVRVTVLPSDGRDVAAMQRLMNWRDQTDPFVLRKELLARLAAAEKNVRRYSAHEPDTDDGRDIRPKCALLGSFAQMGPVAASRAFWEQAATHTELHGTRLGKRDRLCAIGLVKRFAWSAYFRQRAEAPTDGDADYEIGRRYPDIDTVCAAEWLSRAKIEVDLDREKTHTDGPQHRRYWSGHWLRWTDQFDGRRPDLDDPEPCPDNESRNKIKEAKAKLGAPPAYYAVLMLDGDGMGQRVRESDEEQLRQLSQTLASFALTNVRRLVESDDHHGTLVYAGGDDVLAMLPARGALACAQALAEKFAGLTFPLADRFGAASLSGSLVIAHYKANWRDVLATARASEKQAKDARRADVQQREIPGWLALTIQRRSGEHTTVAVPWDHVAQLTALVEDFANSTTDRWAYRLRQQLELLPDDAGPRDAEFHRLLGKAEGLGNSNRDASAVRNDIQKLWSDMNAADSLGNATSFVQLIQSASFLARGGRE